MNHWKIIIFHEGLINDSNWFASLTVFLKMIGYLTFTWNISLWLYYLRLLLWRKGQPTLLSDPPPYSYYHEGSIDWCFFYMTCEVNKIFEEGSVNHSSFSYSLIKHYPSGSVSHPFQVIHTLDHTTLGEWSINISSTWITSKIPYFSKG